MRDMTAIRVMHVIARASRIIRPTLSGFISYCDLSFVNSSITTISHAAARLKYCTSVNRRIHNAGGFPKVNWLHRTDDVDKSVGFHVNFSRDLAQQKSLKSANF